MRKLEGIVAVNHTPVFHGNPSLTTGHPNNRSHSSIAGTDEEVRLKLRDAAVEVMVDVGKVLEEVKTKRSPPGEIG